MEKEIEVDSFAEEPQENQGKIRGKQRKKSLKGTAAQPEKLKKKKKSDFSLCLF